MRTIGQYSELTARQHGLATRTQLREIGIGPASVRRRVDKGELIEMSPAVLRLAGAPPTAHQHAMACVLDAGPGAALARSSALALWAMPGFELEPFHVVRARAHRGTRGGLGIVHLTRDLSPDDVVQLYGIPVTRVERALIDLAGELSFRRLEHTCDRAWSRRMLTGRSLHDSVARLGGRGRHGMRALRALVEARPIDYRPPESNLEARVAEILHSVGERPLRCQVELGTDDEQIGRVDLYDERLRLVFEVQSDLFHTSVSDRRADLARRRRLEVAGYTVIELVEFDVWHRPDRVVEAVRRARRAAEAASIRAC